MYKSWRFFIVFLLFLSPITLLAQGPPPPPPPPGLSLGIGEYFFLLAGLVFGIIEIRKKVDS